MIYWKPGRTCADCSFLWPVKGLGSIGYCRRFPVWTYEQITAAHYCMEWQGGYEGLEHPQAHEEQK
jgi:hypothetical protein